jgi:hypothetical protein
MTSLKPKANCSLLIVRMVFLDFLQQSAVFQSLLSACLDGGLATRTILFANVRQQLLGLLGMALE